MHSKKCLAAACALAALPSVANAVPDYDPALQEAATKLAVSRLGPLRDGFRHDEKPRFNRQTGRNPVASTSDKAGWQDGLAPATDLPRMTIGKP